MTAKNPSTKTLSIPYCNKTKTTKKTAFTTKAVRFFLKTKAIIHQNESQFLNSVQLRFTQTKKAKINNKRSNQTRFCVIASIDRKSNAWMAQYTIDKRRPILDAVDWSRGHLERQIAWLSEKLTKVFGSFTHRYSTSIVRRHVTNS